MNAGDFRLGSNVDIKFTTVDSTGLPVTLLGSPVLSAYPDNSTTEITGGITLTVDFDSRTGFNHARIVATTGNSYAAGSTYHLVITTGTIDGISAVGYVVGMFSIEARSTLTRVGIVQNKALDYFAFLMTDSTTHAPKTGLVNGDFSKKKVAIDNVALTSLGGTISEIGEGWYRISLTAGETNGVNLSFVFEATGCDPTRVSGITTV